MIKEIRNIANSLEEILVNLEHLQSLLQIYGEHREDELTGIDPQEAYTVACLVNRQHIGLALLEAIEDKQRAIQAAVDTTYRKAWDLSLQKE